MTTTPIQDAQSVTVAMVVPVTDEQCRYVLTTALEGGIGYWSIARNLQRDGDHMIFQVDVAEQDDFDTLGEDDCTWHTLLVTDIRRGIETLGKMIGSGIVHPESSIGQGYFAAVASAMQHDACGGDGFAEADGLLADAIVQCAMFGEEIRYG